MSLPHIRIAAALERIAQVLEAETVQPEPGVATTQELLDASQQSVMFWMTRAQEAEKELARIEKVLDGHLVAVAPRGLAPRVEALKSRGAELEASNKDQAQQIMRLKQVEHGLVTGETWGQVLKDARAEAAKAERERIIGIVTDPHNEILWNVPGSSCIHSIHADPRRIRAILEGKP